MRYPRIYSLSTVGIIKHYVQDYLMHHERTDFVGPNGVGKSIIADMLQLLFVYDTALIRFGTDGVKNKDRSIYTLPYKTSHAYFFMNVELEKNRFIIIGIMIPARVGARIVPFVITRSPELNKKIPEIALSGEQLLFAGNFISQKSILDIKTLAEKLYADGLYLNAYRNKEDVKDYYRFLNDKKVTPINLTNEDNLKAFAKVIQSFSKAKSLVLSDGNSIKEFLFDDADKDFISDYETQKASLERLLRQYENLSVFITQLERKQSKLTQLSSLHEEVQKKLKTCQKEKVITAARNLGQAQATSKILEGAYNGQKKEKSSLNRKIERLPSIKEALNEKYEEASENEKLIVDYEELEEQIKHLDDAVNELQFWERMKLSETTKTILGGNDILEVETDEIIKQVSYTNTFLQRYKEWHAIEEQYEFQQKRLEELSRDIDGQIAVHRKWIGLLEKSGDASLISWVLTQGRPLDDHQEAILLKYFDAGTAKPENPEQLSSYVNVPSFLDDAAITEDGNGFWLSLGDMNQFLLLGDQQQQLRLNDSLPDPHDLIKVKTEQVKQLEFQMEEVRKVKKGLPYDNSVLIEDFDLDLVTYANLEKIKKGLGYIADVGQKIRQQETQKGTLSVQLVDLRLKLTGRNVLAEDADLRIHFKGLKALRLKWVKLMEKWEGIFQEKLKKADIDLTASDEQILQTHRRIDELDKEFNELNRAWYQTYAENILIEELTSQTSEGEAAEKIYQEANSNYQRKYIETVNSFDETSEDKNVSINIEQQSGSFSFRPLEEALLGSRIKSTDQIGPALQEAKQSLLLIADSVRDNMIKIFNHTLITYRRYEDIVKKINSFFKLRKISNRFVFNVDFLENKTVKIEYLQNLGLELNNAHKRNEIPFGEPVSTFIEEFFKKAARLPEIIKVHDLLNPKTYFDLNVRLTSDQQANTSGSTGETYSAIALLGIARLSLVETDSESGLRFIILEETGSLDNINFSTFPTVAKEYGYQIITMAPRPFGITLSEEWYLHHLIKGKVDEDINHSPPASFFYTKNGNADLHYYLKKKNVHELD